MERLLEELRTALRVGAAQQEFPPGTVILDQWHDIGTDTVLDAPLVVVNYSTVWTKSGKALGAVLLRKTALATMCFSSENNLYDSSDVSSWLATDYDEGCSETLRNMVAETEIELASGKMLARHFLPSLTELNIRKSEMLHDGQTWEYFQKKKPWRGTIWRTGDVPPDCWLRSEYEGLNRYAWVLSASGNIMLYNVKSTSMCMPACIVV